MQGCALPQALSLHAAWTSAPTLGPWSRVRWDLRPAPPSAGVLCPGVCTGTHAALSRSCAASFRVSCSAASCDSSLRRRVGKGTAMDGGGWQGTRSRHGSRSPHALLAQACSRRRQRYSCPACAAERVCGGRGWTLVREAARMAGRATAASAAGHHVQSYKPTKHASQVFHASDGTLHLGTAHTVLRGRLLGFRVAVRLSW